MPKKRKQPPKRWHVEISYRLRSMETTITDIEELDELHNYVERGPDWNTIKAIRVTLNTETK